MTDVVKQRDYICSLTAGYGLLLSISFSASWLQWACQHQHSKDIALIAMHRAAHRDVGDMFLCLVESLLTEVEKCCFGHICLGLSCGDSCGDSTDLEKKIVDEGSVFATKAHACIGNLISALPTEVVADSSW